MANTNKQSDPLGELFSGISKIMEFIEVKNLKEANAAESADSKELSEMWMNAKLGNDTYITYHNYWKLSMFQEVLPNIKINNFNYFMENPYNIPIDFRDTLLTKGKEAFFNEYEETNDYYRMLQGLPPISTTASDYVHLSESLRNKLHSADVPVHELSTFVQNRYMATDEYRETVQNNPDKKYLRYLGMYKVDLFTARNAKDFDIIRYPSNRSDINPNLLKEFGKLYNEYREYVMVVLYNREFENLYKGYREFMGALIYSFVLLQIANSGVGGISSHTFLDDSVLYTILSMYGIPSSITLTNEVRRDLVINILKLVREKGTMDVYYDLVKILGYQEVAISKLMLMKGKQFDPNNNYRATDDIEPYFLQLDLKDKNPYDTITKGEAPLHTYKKIIENDPTWWDLEDTRKVLRESNYTIADSKYIMIEAVIHQMRYMFESIYFVRMITDNKSATDSFYIEIPEIFGTDTVSVFDLMVFIIAATCMQNGLSGEFDTEENRLLATAGFNFDLDIDTFMEYISTTKYVDKERLMSFMENLTINDQADISRLFNDIMYPMREWLEREIADATEREAYIEYESIYRALFTYDITKNPYRADFKMPIEIIKETYDITDEDFIAYQHFYPRTMEGEAVTLETISSSRYQLPFLNVLYNVDWYIHIVINTPQGEDDRGYLYFHDILNSDDLRKITRPNGLRIFMDYNDGEIGWEVNKLAVEKALELIDQLPDDQLLKAFYQVETYVEGSRFIYAEGEKLPAYIRAGIYKNILKEKIKMDMAGLAVPAHSYQDYLYRKNPKLYNLLLDGNRFELDHDAWLEDVMKIVLTIETELDVHMKYFEQSVMGPVQFFKPLITLIKHFKSTFVNFAHTGLKYVFADKVDIGGNSNMFKLFDEVEFIVHFVTLANDQFESVFGLEDAEAGMKYHAILADRPESLIDTSRGTIGRYRDEHMGSLRFVDEMKFFLNGKPIDPDGNPSYWLPGEPESGELADSDEILMQDRKNVIKIPTYAPDMEGWKDFVESYNPIE